MVAVTRTLIAAGLIWAVPALGQTVQDHDSHHPNADTAVAQAPTPPAAPQAGRMGAGMMGQAQMGAGMMPMMNMMMGAQAGDDHFEGRLAFIKAELKITDAQAQPWNAFADAVRSNIGSMAEMRKSMMGGEGAPSTLPERLAREDKMVTAHLAALRKTEDAVAQLYVVLTDEQKKTADTIVVGPMGIPMGMM
jgi:hypothetical protein